MEKNVNIQTISHNSWYRILFFEIFSVRCSELAYISIYLLSRMQCKLIICTCSIHNLRRGELALEIKKYERERPPSAVSHPLATYS